MFCPLSCLNSGVQTVDSARPVPHPWRMDPIASFIQRRNALDTTVSYNRDLGTAERIVQTRQRQPFNGTDDVKALLPPNIELDVNRASIASSFFEIIGRLRLERRVLEDRWYVERKGLDIVPWRRERITRDESMSR